MSESSGPSAAHVSTVLAADGTRLRMLEWKARSERGRVVVVHGLGEHAGRYEILARALVAGGYSVVAYDQRGHGLSGGARVYASRIGQLADDLSAVLASPAGSGGPGPPFAFAQSMGALVLLRYLQTARSPVPAGVVLSAPWLGTAAPVSAWKRLLGIALRYVAPRWPVPTGLDAGALTSDEERQRNFLEDPLVVHAVTAGLWDAVGSAQAEALAHGAGLGVPALVLLPLADSVADVATTEAWLGRAGSGVRVARLPGLRHEPHNEVARGEVFHLILDWLDGRTPAGLSG